MKIKIQKKRLYKLTKIIAQYKFRIFIAIFCMTILAISTAASAWMIKPILENIFFEKNKFMLNVIPIIIIIIYILRSISMYGQEYNIEYIGQCLIKKLRNKLYYNIVDFPLSLFEKKKIGSLMSRITYDVNIVKNMISTAVAGSIRDIFTIISLIIVIFCRDWKMATFAFIILPLALIPMIKFGKKIRSISTNIQNSMAELNIFLQETFVGNKIIKSFNTEFFEKKRFKKKTEKIFLIEIENIITKALSSPTMELLGGIAVAFVIWYGGYQVITNKSEPGTFFSFITAVIMLYDPVKKLTKVNNSLQEGMSAIHRIFDLFELKEYSYKKKLSLESQYYIKFNKVFFNYNKKKILKNLTFKAYPGKTIAIVGKSGSGKTSIINLIPRFYDINKGKILINNNNIYDISLKSLRNKISIVTQEPILFNNTIKNNIAYGKLNSSIKEIKKAAKSAYAYDFIQKLPNGFNTLIGEFGNKLSGGEKQRLCIARAILKNSPILILDEATSSLDFQSETLIQKALKNLIIGRTCIIIAHRLSTIVKANIILVLSDGRIVEKGTHSQLIKKQKQYYKLYSSQLNQYYIKKNNK